MKKKESRYTVKQLNPDFYSKIKLSGMSESLNKENNALEPGYVLAPYMVVNRDPLNKGHIEREKEYDKFMKKYHKEVFQMIEDGVISESQVEMFDIWRR